MLAGDVELSGRHGERPELHTVIADIRFANRMRTVFEQYRPDVVFHSAAHKHVPLMEQNPVEAITNNVLGTRNVLEASLDAGVEHFVLISTDKAVNPTSVMGASKRVAELLVHKVAETRRKPFVAVRFGNVLGSRGSVVLTFKRQIAAGGPVTVTHPDMMRYFMTIPEAVQLVLQSAPLGRGGEVFMLDMGEPVKIADLARDMIELSGLHVGRDIDIQFVGVRPGEKLYEELFVPGERYEATTHEKVFIATNATNFLPERLDSNVEWLIQAAEQNDVEGIFEALQVLVPEAQLETLAKEARTRKAVPVGAIPFDAAEDLGSVALGSRPLVTEMPAYSGDSQREVVGGGGYAAFVDAGSNPFALRHGRAKAPEEIA
jgi:FlaA1/EpsC-like NDP-sugar epimerase